MLAQDDNYRSFDSLRSLKMTIYRSFGSLCSLKMTMCPQKMTVIIRQSF